MATDDTAVSESWLNAWKALSRRRRIGHILLLMLSALSLWICLRIEWLNYKAGFKLPRDTSHYPSGASRAWRSLPTHPEYLRKKMGEAYRFTEAVRQEKADPWVEVDRSKIEIPPGVWKDIDRRLPEVLRRNRIEMNLRDMAMLGILQYPLCVALIIGGCWRDRRKSGRLELSVYGFALLTGALGLVRAWQLSYASSVFD